MSKTTTPATIATIAQPTTPIIDNKMIHVLPHVYVPTVVVNTTVVVATDVLVGTMSIKDELIGYFQT